MAERESVRGVISGSYSTFDSALRVGSTTVGASSRLGFLSP